MIRTVLAILAIPFSGCAPKTTILIPANSLPSLSTGETQNAKTWPDVYTIDGERWRIKGTIERVGIQKGSNVVLINPPFTARIENEQLKVLASNRLREFPLRNIANVSVTYDDAKQARNRIGAVLMSLGGASLLIAPISAIGKPWDEKTTQIVSGFVVTHFLLTIPGIYFVSTDPPAPGRWSTAHRPMLHLAPGGAAISGAF